jgi:hypothetical protein
MHGQMRSVNVIIVDKDTIKEVLQRGLDSIEEDVPDDALISPPLDQCFELEDVAGNKIYIQVYILEADKEIFDRTEGPDV